MAVLYFFLLSFFLHLLWENLQAPLYQGYISFAQHFPSCLIATATGDILMMLFLYLTLAVVHEDLFWVADRSAFEYPATWLLPVLLGVLVAISFELWAVYVAHRYAYAAMPLLPIVRIGVTPILQMVIVPLLTILLVLQSPFVE